jgi:hypothetical protein
MGELSDRDLQQQLALDGAAGPARPIDPARSASIVAAVLQRAGFPPPGTGGGSGASGPKAAGSPQGSGRGASHAAGRATIAPKLTVLVGGAGAIAIAVVAWLSVRAPDRPPAAPVGPTPAAHASQAQAEGEQVQGDPAPAPPATDERVPGEQATSAAAPDEPSRAHAPTAAPAKLRATTTPAHRRRSPPRAAAVAAAPEPEDLLAEANAARLARDWRAADALYSRVASAGGTALAAQTALVASAQLHLEHLGDPAGAARRFRSALAAGARDTLAEEARWGLAEVARATAEPAAERRALDDFLAHHASSVRASQARARRAELEAAP